MKTFLFSLPFIEERNKQLFIFTPVFAGREDKKLFIFTPVFGEEKRKNFFIFTPFYWGDIYGRKERKEGKCISSNHWLPGSFSYSYWELSLYKIAK